MKYTLLLLTVTLTFALAGCNLTLAPTTPTTVSTPAPTLEFDQSSSAALPTTTSNQPPEIIPAPHANSSPQQAVIDQAFIIISALKDKDMTTVSQYVSPQMGLRFSPYAAVKNTDQAFSAGKVAGLMTDSTAYGWGAFSGSGEPITKTFSDYYSMFIYDVDFANAPQVALNFRMGVSTSLDNSADYYPGAMVVEFHFSGFDTALEGMDWRSLRLVFMQESSTWYMVGIIHDQWTT